MTETRDAEIAQYRALSATAVVALVLGLVSGLAMVDRLLWVVPPVGIVFSAAALWRIAQARGGLVGRKAALAGLALSVLFAAAAPTDWIVYRYLVREEARRFARAWLGFLAEDQPHMAHQLTVHPKDRRPLDERLPDYYAERFELRNELKKFVGRAPVNTLLELGSKAELQHVATVGQTRTGLRDSLYLVYAVTSAEADAEEALLVGLSLERVQLKTGRANWRLRDVRRGRSPQNGQ